jgi:ribosomal protein L40E
MSGGTIVLMAAETCDRCGARATHRAEGPEGCRLTFCEHHTKEQRPGLEARGWRLVDLAKAAATTA